MRKDYIDVSNDNITEIEFIEQYWSDIWKNEGGPKNKIEKIPNKPEYKIMKPYLNEIKSGIKMLDGGCGLGDWTAYFSNAGYDITGIDISTDVIMKLKKYFPYASFDVGDIRNTNFPNSNFDIYFSWGVFEHFEQGLRPCLDEAARLLKPNGLLFISVPADNLRHSVLGALRRFIKKPNKNGERFYQWRLTRTELSKELSLAGFSIETIQPIHKRQGILRSLHHEFKLPYEWFITKVLSILLTPFIPGILIAHMYIAVARKM
jgi:2-polyprenyl-3-methyl-5-hydroxy-6-metoxy-1,4-benzoquinol methylase